MNETTMEILAPAGGQEQLIAAVRSGASAVYLGTKGFNARQNAQNFTSLGEAVSYCRARGVLVYVALNTLVMDDEMPALLETIREIAQSGADGVIVQDLAVAYLVRERCPTLALHASTQMTIHNGEGARALRGLGFTRVVLARELTIDEIKAIRDRADIELEAFVHGALCMSASGACYLSAMIGGRSGNRGLCAQPCRLDFRAGERPFALSLKDLSALSHVKALGEAGVTSLKIEGRMKGPAYVAAAVTACREAVAGNPYDEKALAAVFSRDGFTDGYLTGKRTLAMFGVRRQEDVAATRESQGDFSHLYRRERANIPVEMVLTLSGDGPATLSITDGVHRATATGEAPQIASHASTDGERARRSLGKLGDTPFILASLTLHNEGGWMLPTAALNAMRRQAGEELLALRGAAISHDFMESPLPPITPHIPAERPALRLRFAEAHQLWEGAEAERIILPVDQITGDHISRYPHALVAELPALCFPGDVGRIRAKLKVLKELGLAYALCENMGMVSLAKEVGLIPLGGAGLNILNTAALLAYGEMGVADVTVSFEMHREKLRRLGGEMVRGAIGYGYLPLMRLRSCPLQGPEGCGSCPGHGELTDRMGARFPVLCHKKRFATLSNALPLNLSGEPLPGADFMTLYFTQESQQACRAIADGYARGDGPVGERTRGLYHRGVR